MDEMELYKRRKRKARLAGLGYLVLAFAAWPDILRKTLFVTGDPVATSTNILANVGLFRLSILGDIVTELSFLFLSLCLYSLLKEVRKSASRAMLLLVVIAVTITILSTGFEIAAVRLFETTDQIHGNLLLGVYQAFIFPAAVFYGLWMLPLGYLFFKSSFMPRTLGVILMIGSSGYVIHAVSRIIQPDASEQFLMISVVAEVITIIWLLGFGVKRPLESNTIQPSS